VRRAAAAVWAALEPRPAPLQVRARAAGADRRRAGSTRAVGPAHAATREGAAAREEQRSGQGNAHAGVTHAYRVRRAVKGRRQRRLDSGVDRAQREKRRTLGLASCSVPLAVVSPLSPSRDDVSPAGAREEQLRPVVHAAVVRLHAH
jgi:hypothetical protein